VSGVPRLACSTRNKAFQAMLSVPIGSTGAHPRSDTISRIVGSTA
jgi:hypothetical protein